VEALRQTLVQVLFLSLCKAAASKRRADAIRLFAGVPTGSLLKLLSTGNSRDGGLHPPYVNDLLSREWNRLGITVTGLDANERRTHMIDPAPHALAAGADTNAEPDSSSALFRPVFQSRNRGISIG
jgi:hypothetical protein